MKNTDIHIRVTENEKAKILRKAEKAKLTITEYIVKSSLNSNIIVEADKSQYINELRRIGNNINQITKKVNQGIVREVNLKETKMELNKIWQLLSS